MDHQKAFNETTGETFYTRLVEAAEFAETHDVIRLGGLSIRQIAAVKAACQEAGDVGSFDVTDLSSEAFLSALLDDVPKDLTEDELAEGRALLPERRKPPRA
jgi:hypothetical protein